MAGLAGAPGPVVVYRAVLLEALQYWTQNWAWMPGQVTTSLIQERHVAPMPEGFAFDTFDTKRTEVSAAFALEAPHASALLAGPGACAKRGSRARFVEPEALLVGASCPNPFSSSSEVAAATDIGLASVEWERATVLVTESHGEIPVLVGRAAVGNVPGLSMYVAAEVRSSFLGSHVLLAVPLHNLMGAVVSWLACVADRATAQPHGSRYRRCRLQQPQQRQS